MLFQAMCNRMGADRYLPGRHRNFMGAERNFLGRAKKEPCPSLIPHCDLDPECCGCLCEVVDESGSHFVCNECSAVVSKEDVARLVLEMESTVATCPHCGRVNHIERFSEVFAFRCRFCGQGATV